MREERKFNLVRKVRIVAQPMLIALVLLISYYSFMSGFIKLPHRFDWLVFILFPMIVAIEVYFNILRYRVHKK